jgi:hypothetical protein
MAADNFVRGRENCPKCGQYPPIDQDLSSHVCRHGQPPAPDPTPEPKPKARHPFPKTREEMLRAAEEVVADTTIDLGLAEQVYQDAVGRQHRRVYASTLANRMAQQVLISLSDIPDEADWARAHTVIKQVGLMDDVAKLVIRTSQLPCRCEFEQGTDRAIYYEHDTDCLTGMAMTMLATLRAMEEQRKPSVAAGVAEMVATLPVEYAVDAVPPVEVVMDECLADAMGEMARDELRWEVDTDDASDDLEGSADDGGCDTGDKPDQSGEVEAGDAG